MGFIEEQRLIGLLKKDPQRIAILKAVSTLTLPNCWVAAGFVRNLVWDYFHDSKTSLNDVDVIYYCQADTQADLAVEALKQLQKVLPKVNWQIKNQALMHIKRQHSQYLSSADAMTYWPEKETAIGVSLDENQCFSFVAPFGFTSLFEKCITFNPKSDEQVFLKRIEQKGWLTTWPELVVKDR
jgi:hypothetical protein